jgi:Big-like domain-containing protein
LVASLLGVAALLAALSPASALAGTYGWGLPGDFGGHNPEQKYGQPSWSYVGAGGSLMTTFSSNTWSDGQNDSVTAGGGTTTIHAAAGSSASIVWTSPFTSNQAVTVTSTGWSGSGLGCILGSVSVPGGTVVVGPGQHLAVAVSAGPLGSCSASGTISIFASTPTVTITNPASGAAITNGVPTLSGTASTAFDASGTVSVSVYSGSSASGTPLQTLSGTVGAGGTFSVTPSALANGKYTAVAEQDDPLGSPNTSAPVTFTVANPSSTVSLASPGGGPLTDSTPALTGTAGTRGIDSNHVTVLIYAGAGTDSAPIRRLTGAIGSGGAFSVQVTPALPDGQYTALASQDSSAGIAYSHTVGFRVKVHPPALTLGQPGNGVTLNVVKPTFSGAAGDALGDSGSVSIHLYRGATATGSPLASERVRANGAHWSIVWPHRLAYGLYTVVAVQTDDAGHTARTQPHTFSVAPTPKLIGARATLTRNGDASVSVGCLAGPGQMCTGTVLIVTQRSYRTTHGGPTGPLEVLFAKVRISGGRSKLVRRSVTDPVLRLLLRHHRVDVVVTVKLSSSVGSPSDAQAHRVLRLAR